jgi:hypothetical protein
MYKRAQKYIATDNFTFYVLQKNLLVTYISMPKCNQVTTANTNELLLANTVHPCL